MSVALPCNAVEANVLLSTPDKTGSWIRKNSEWGLNSCESSYEERFCQGFSGD